MELARINHWSPPGSGPGFVYLPIGSDNTSNGHEHAMKVLCVSAVSLEGSPSTYPKVAPEPAIYLPSVRMIPLGPAP